MKITAYFIDGDVLEIRPASVDRAWMDATNNRFAYRGLPLVIANAHGWETLCSGGFAARWDGWPAPNAISIWSDLGEPPAAVSHFGHGILTSISPAFSAPILASFDCTGQTAERCDSAI